MIIKCANEDCLSIYDHGEPLILLNKPKGYLTYINQCPKCGAMSEYSIKIETRHYLEG